MAGLGSSAAGLWRLAGSFGGDEVVGAEPFDGVDLPLTALWPEAETEPEEPPTATAEAAPPPTEP